MFKLKSSTDRYLLVKSVCWSIRPSLDAKKILLGKKGHLLCSGSAAQGCPGHPSNMSSSNSNNWRFYKQGENQAEKQEGSWEEGGVVVRCSVHDADHSQWLVEQGRKGFLEKKKVAALLCEEDNRRSLLLSLLDTNSQQEVAVWNRQEVGKIAHLMDSDFINWLIQMADKGQWSKEDVGNIVCRNYIDGQLILATLDQNTQRQAAGFAKEETSKVAHFLGAEFVQWLIQEASEGNWGKEEVCSIVCRKNEENQLVLLSLDLETQKQVAVFDRAKICDALRRSLFGLLD